MSAREIREDFLKADICTIRQSAYFKNIKDESTALKFLKSV